MDPERKAYIFDQIGYKPHSPKQAEIHDSDARFKVLACGRRYGKTIFGGKEITAAICDPEEVGYYWIVGPKYVTGEKEFRVVYDDVIKKLKWGDRVKKSYNVKQGDMRIEMPWGTILEVKSAERKDGLLGEGLKGVLLSECAQHDAETWEQFIRPALSDHKGWAIFSSTPKGYNWFQGLYMLGQLRELHPEYESWCLPSWENPIVFPEGFEDPEIQEQKDRLSPEFFAQEIAAEFVSYAGKIYTEFGEHNIKSIEYNPLWSNYWTFDYGWNNPFVCLDIMVDPEDNVYVWREFHKSHDASFNHGHHLLDRNNPPHFHVDGRYGDPRGGDSKANLEIVLGAITDPDVDWTIGIEYVKRWLKLQPNGKPKLYIDPSCVELIRQLERLEYEPSSSGRNPREQQHKYDDHGPDALRYFMSQHFYLGGGSSLADIYSGNARQSEAATFFQNNSPIGRYARY